MKTTWRQRLNKVERSPAFITLAVTAHAMLVLSVVGIMASVANKTALLNTGATSYMWTLGGCIIALNAIVVRMARAGKDSHEA